MSSLPDGWEAVTSKDGMYFWNTETGEVTWKKPTNPAKKAPPPPPPISSSPPASETTGYDPFNYAEDFSQEDITSLQPLPTCYENVVLLEEIGQSSQQNEVDGAEWSQTTPTPSLERYLKGPGEVEYTRVNRSPDRKSAFRHSAVKRKFSNNVEELVITREELDKEIDKPNPPERSPSFSKEMEREMSEEALSPALPPEDPEEQFTAPFSKQYEDIDEPVILNKAQMKSNLSYNRDQDPLLNSPEANISTIPSHVQSRDSGLGLSSSSQVTSYPETSPPKISSTTRPGTLYENVELTNCKEERSHNKNGVQPAELPKGWKEIESDTGHSYYWHIESGITQWEFPTGPPLSPEPTPPARPSSSSDSSQPSTSSLLPSPKEHIVQERTDERNFSAFFLGLQDVDSNEIKHGQCSNIIENCIRTVIQRVEEGEKIDEREVVLQVSPGVLKELDENTNEVNKAHAINRIRAWGCSRENARYFAYIIRHNKTQTYKCNIYKCKTSAKSLTLALKEFTSPSQQFSDSSSQSSPKRLSKLSPLESIPDSTQQPNEGEHSYQRFKVTYLGLIRVSGESGMELIWTSLEKLSNHPANWVEAAIDISSTHFRIIDAKSGDVLTETRVRFLSFLGLSKDDSMCGYITGDDGTFFCNGFKMEPNCVELCISMKKACEDRFERVQQSIDTNTVSSSASSQKKQSLESTFRVRAESAGEKIGGFFKSKISRVGRQVGTKLQRTSSAKTLYGTYQVQLFGSAQVPIENDKRSVEDAITYLEGQSSRLTNPYVVEFQITQGGFLFIDKEKRQFGKKFFSIGNIRYCLKKGHSVAFVVQNKAGTFDAFAFGEINTSASVIIETIQTAVNNNT